MELELSQIFPCPHCRMDTPHYVMARRSERVGMPVRNVIQCLWFARTNWSNTRLGGKMNYATSTSFDQNNKEEDHN